MRLVILDAHAIIHRAYHALPDFTSASGEPTGGLYGLVSMLLRLIKDLKPDYIVACYDRPEETFRKEAYSAYKAQRVKADDDLIAQIERARDVFKALAIPIYDKAGFEADDCIGTIVEQVKKDKRLEVIIATGDMDTLQLVSGKRVKVFTLRKGITDTVTYDEKGVVERFGFPVKLLPDYKGLRGDPSDNIPGIPGIGEKSATELIQKFGSIEDIYKELKKDSSVFEKRGIKKRVIELLREHEEEALFSKELSTIRKDVPIEFALRSLWKESFKAEEADALFMELGFKALRARLAGFTDQLAPQASLLPAPTSSLSEEELEETKVALWLLDSNHTNPSVEDILAHANTRDLKEAREKVLSQIKKDDLTEVFEKIEIPLLPILKRASQHGILVDKTFFEKLAKEYHAELSKIESRIWKLAGKEFNINSPKQLGEIIFNTLAIKGKIKKTKTGNFSTKAGELEKLSGFHPIIDEILNHREYQKLLSTYIDAIPKLLDEKSRLHTTFVQTGTTTGRISSQNPNLQNIPIKTELGRKIRTGFVASPGFKLLALDYSQIDLRVAAHLSGDLKLISLFKSGEDIHTVVASEVFGVSPKDVDRELRRRAKVINFGIIYGMGANALRSNLGSTREEAEEYLEKYFKTFPELAQYLEDIKKKARKDGFTLTHFGRRRYFSMIKSPLPYIRAGAERMAMNAPIQGTTADIIKLAMVRADKSLQRAGLADKVIPLLQVHDELVYEVEEGALSKAAELIKGEMEGAFISKIPFTVNVKIGDNWGEL